MKRYLIIAFSLLALASIQAQTFNYTGLEIKQEKVKKKNVYEWENFVLANYSLGFIDDFKLHSFGITYGRVKLFGYYANVMVSTGMHYGNDYTAEWDGSLGQDYIYSSSGYYSYTQYYDLYPFYTGKNSYNRASLTLGGIVRMVIPLYLYIGAGYGYQSVTRQISSGKWVMIRPFSVTHGMMWDVGLQGSIKGFTISAGYSVLTVYDYRTMHELKVGLGYTFKDKKK